MDNKGLTFSLIFEAESANYGEGVGNVTSLKKIARGNGESYSYISRQALRYNIVDQMGINNTPLNLDGTVIQFHPDATIEEYAEIDLFGYMKTIKPTKTRSAVVRLSNAIALEGFQTDTDFLTNKGLLDRYNSIHDEERPGGNISQNEIHKSFYTYTITIDLDRIGIDGEVEIDTKLKAERVINLLQTIKFLYRDIKGRRENLTPLFIVGGIYDRKNPFFENRLKIKNHKLQVEIVKSVLDLGEEVKEHTNIGYIDGIFENNHEIKELNPISISEFFNQLDKKVLKYYTE